MSAIGNLNITTGDNGLLFGRGQFRTLATALQIRMDPDPQYGGRENTPTHKVCAVTPGGDVPIGAAWTKQMVRGQLAGEAFYSMTLDDPSFPEPLNLSAFPRVRNAADYEIVWQRPRLPSAQQVADNATAYDAAKNGSASDGQLAEQRG